MPLAGFIRGMFETALEPGEIITAVRVPAAHSRRCAYLKMRQSASGFALIGVAVQLEVERGRVKSAAVGVTGAARSAYRAAALEKRLSGLEASGITEALLAEAARGITSGMDLLGDLHASAEFRAHLAEVYARRAVLLAAARS
jgi:carbon-monoxide dehydrogenase medium subunit